MFPKPLRRKSKFNNVRTGGYASKVEARRADFLRELQRRGEISDLHEQRLLDIHPDGCTPIRYRPDFVYDENGVTVVEDVKGGLETDVFKMKWKLARWKYPTHLFRIVRYDKRREAWLSENFDPRDKT